MFDNGTIFLVSSSVYELAWLSKLPVEALARLDFLNTEESSLALSAIPALQASAGPLLARSRSLVAPEPLSPIRLLLDSLVRQQHLDGCWGSSAVSLGDRLINTLAVLTALAYNRQRWGQFQPTMPNY